MKGRDRTLQRSADLRKRNEEAKGLKAYLEDAEAVLAETGSSMQGLTDEEAAARLTRDGPNRLKEEMKELEEAGLSGSNGNFQNEPDMDPENNPGNDPDGGDNDAKE